MTKTQQRPTPQVLRACRLIDDSIPGLVSAIGFPTGTWEAEVEARLLLNVVVRNVESIVMLGRSDLVLLPSAWVLSRAALEASTLLRWVIAPTSEFEREARFLVHLRSEEQFLGSVVAERRGAGASTEKAEDWRESLREFRNGVIAQLPDDLRAKARADLPSMKEMLRSLGAVERYAAYRTGCQFAHGTHVATWLYRAGGVGTNKSLGEFVSARDWHGPLVMAWSSLLDAAKDLHRCLGRTTGLVSQSRLAEIDEVLRSVAENSNG